MVPDLTSSSNASSRRAPAYPPSERITARRRSQSLREPAPSAISRRRSVSSMKSLMPLRLSTSCSSLTSSDGFEERLEVELDGNIPEILVRDLEISNAVFAIRNMTAGKPISDPQSSPFGEGQGLPTCSLPSRRTPSPTHPMHVPSLRPIEEISSVASLHGGYDDQEMEYESSSEVDSFACVDALSIPARRQSLTAFTAATSLSSSGNLRSPKTPESPSAETTRQMVCSWMDEDSETEDAKYTNEEEPPTGFLSPRPATPSIYASSLTGSGVAMYKERHEHRRSQSMTVTPKWTPRARQAGQVASHGLSSDCTTPEADTQFSTTTFGGPAQSPLLPSPHIQNSPQMGRFEAPMQRIHEPVPDIVEPFAMSYENVHSMTGPRQTAQELFIKPSPPPSPPPTIQQYLTNSITFSPSPIFLEDSTKVIPLPPDTLETLRVSVTCFPETMLLTSSLTLETIRTYAKKVRHPHLDLQRMTPPPSPFQSRTAPGKFLWRKVSSYRRREDAAAQNAANDDDAPKPWMGLRVILGGASEHVCDALYAHILAFNYVSALLPHFSAPSGARRRDSGISQTTTGQRDREIPKKALTLLGIKVPGSPTNGEANTLQQQNQEATLRDVHAGLLRCITGLLATARMMVDEGCSDDGAVLASGPDVDGFLLRSLCEVVRLAEDVM